MGSHSLGSGSAFMNGNPSHGDPVLALVFLVFAVYSILAIVSARGWKRKCHTALVIIAFMGAGIAIGIAIGLAWSTAEYGGYVGGSLAVVMGAIGAVCMHKRNKKDRATAVPTALIPSSKE